MPVGNARERFEERLDIASYNKADARACNRHYWPETDVGASLARDAPRGRRSISRALYLSRQASKSLDALYSQCSRFSALKYRFPIRCTPTFNDS
ncbi:hypothetical protein PspTeo4_06760 [Pseudomonas sp. Teo4]|nr:hypothetical protein [Pseudomonas sp. Teo4]